MVSVTKRSFLIGAAAIAVSPGTAHADPRLDSLKVMTEDYPPYNYEEDGVLRGISVDIVVEMLKRAGATIGRSDIELLPWARGYNLTLNRADHALFSTTRTAEREALFKWVGPFVTTVIGLTARKDRHLSVRSLEDLRDLRIGVVKDDIGHLLLKSAGIPEDQLDVVLYNDQNYRKLAAGRVDAISYETSVARWGLASIGEDLSQYEVIYKLTRGDLYLALNPQISDDLIDLLQQAFDSMVSDGTREHIRSRYLS